MSKLYYQLGSGVQEWHTDDSMTQHKKHRYFTILINLNPLDAYCGGTEVWIDKLKRGDLVSVQFLCTVVLCVLVPFEGMGTAFSCVIMKIWCYAHGLYCYNNCIHTHTLIKCEYIDVKCLLIRCVRGQEMRWYSLDPCCTEVTPTRGTCTGSSITRALPVGPMRTRVFDWDAMTIGKKSGGNYCT